MATKTKTKPDINALVHAGENTPGEQGVVSDVHGILAQLGITPENLKRLLNDAVIQPAKVLSGNETIGQGVANADAQQVSSSPAKAKSTAKKKKAPATTSTSPSEVPTQADLNAALQNSPWGKLGAAISGDLSGAVQPSEVAMAGGLTAPAEAQAANTALGALGLSPNSSASQWLNSQIKAANAADDPMTQAMQAYEGAFAQGETGVEKALTNMGGANEAFIESAPMTDWLQMITQHIGSNLNYYGYAPESAIGGLPAAIQVALAESGPGGAPGPGSETVGQIKLPESQLQALGLTPSVITALQGKSVSTTSLSSQPAIDTRAGLPPNILPPGNPNQPG